jgi:hypothetical protein
VSGGAVGPVSAAGNAFAHCPPTSSNNCFGTDVGFDPAVSSPPDTSGCQPAP